MKRTKIIATLGPATNNKDILKRIIEEGVELINYLINLIGLII